MIDNARFDDWVSRYRPIVFAVCMRMLDHRQDAEDATQETFSRLYRYGGRLDPTRPVLPYLKRIASNRCRTAIARRRPTVALPGPVEDPSPSATMASVDGVGTSFREELQWAMAHLPPRHRQAFERFHLQQKSYPEIAGEMGCAEATVRTWVRRARVQLMETLRRREVQ